MELTTKQLFALLEKIRIRTTTNRYYEQSFFASLHGAEIKTLEEILGVGLYEESAFDEATDKLLDRLAQENLEKAKRGGQ